MTDTDPDDELDHDDSEITWDEIEAAGAVEIETHDDHPAPLIANHPIGKGRATHQFIPTRDDPNGGL